MPAEELPVEAVAGTVCENPDGVACDGACTVRCVDGVWTVRRCNPKCGAGLQVVTE